MTGTDATSNHAREANDARKRAWISPSISQLPRLTDLTLQSPMPVEGGGGTEGGGSTVIP